MKKIVAFVLALVMVLGMATVAFAAKEDAKVEVVKWDLKNSKVTLKITVLNDDVKTVFVADDFTSNEDAYTIGELAVKNEIVYEFAKETDVIGVEVTKNPWKTSFDEPDFEIEVPRPQWEVLYAVEKALDQNRDTVEIDIDELENETMTKEDWDFLFNNGYTFELGTWDYNYKYMNMNIKFFGTDANGYTVIYYMDAADIDYTWDKPVCFTMTNGCTEYTKSATEIKQAIRKLTADATRDPFTFGWKKEQTVPAMTISVVIPQQWLNVYGNKGLTLWAYNMENDVKCEVCGAVAKDKEAAKLAEDTADANAQTQRIVLDTDTLYKTLVLSTVAVEAEAKADANPNTGANDIVNVAIVLSVISLVAAGAFVFSKQR